ncbi:MAG: 2,3-bisphosphoglycerate-independent phosphoglycerate mutase [Phycisphaerales bacterium]
MAAPKNTPLVLIIRDGWGENPNPEHDRFNAIKLARTPIADRLDREFPRTLVKTSGEDVGLPDGTMGNSEVGHQNIGAGRIVYQESVAITKVCREGELAASEALAGAIRDANAAGRTVHLMGIASDAGVHGLLTHLYALLDLCGDLGVPAERAAVHFFTDGRDTGPFTGKEFVAIAERRMREIGVGRVASVIGRYWAMDRDFRWERVHRAFACLTGRGAKELGAGLAPTAAEAIQRHYDAPEKPGQAGDEFIPPTMIGTPEDACRTRIADGDTVIFYNYRGDRPRELSMAFVLPDDNWAAVKPSPDTGRPGFDRGPRLDLRYVTMTAYSEELAPYVRVAFPRPPKMANIAGEYLSGLGLAQFRCAETEKYPHVTFFFNDYRDQPYPGERRENPQSPRVATYDLKPEMAAYEVRDAVLRRLAAPDCEPFIVVNFANGDMVGHTGVLEAAVRAVEVVDECVGAVVEATLGRGGSLIVTADHGNAEQMWDPATNAPHTAHTVYDVPLYVVGEGFRGGRLREGRLREGGLREGGRLADIVPTALEMMGLPVPPEMTGRSLLA